MTKRAKLRQANHLKPFVKYFNSVFFLMNFRPIESHRNEKKFNERNLDLFEQKPVSNLHCLFSVQLCMIQRASSVSIFCAIGNIPGWSDYDNIGARRSALIVRCRISCLEKLWRKKKFTWITTITILPSGALFTSIPLSTETQFSVTCQGNIFHLWTKFCPEFKQSAIHPYHAYAWF